MPACASLRAENAALRRRLSDQEMLVEQLRFQAFHDFLTKLANRALFLDRLEHALAARRRDPLPVGVLFLDLDDFKSVNDTWGHAVGDELLVAVADRLGDCVRPSDTAARLGGDEFAVLLGEVASLGGAVHVARRIVGTFGTAFHLHDRVLQICVSVGVAFSVAVEESAADIMRAADAAMYVAKRAGKNRYACAPPREGIATSA